MASPAGPSECDVVREWLGELGVAADVGMLTDTDVAALYQWCCTARVEHEAESLLKGRVSAVNHEALNLEVRLESVLGVRCDELPVAQDLARSAALLGVNQVEPALVCGAVADLQDELFALEENQSELRAERADLTRKCDDARLLKGLLARTEEAWGSYVQRRSADSAHQQQQTSLHHDKVKEYHRRLDATQSQLEGIGVEDALKHNALCASVETLKQQSAKLRQLQRKVSQYKVPPSSSMAQAKLAQLRAEVKDLQSRLPRNGRGRGHH
eukprot:TRINITY_DN328_c0_g1_i1.p1 TRINITY_DN328_c0_g1~~TRINITY_DN328_c0_g1_i1.p1  ORF type:complete len:270 (+),score=52.09 TRINITY_DN328_c0_g1_i1:518-1327(+)